MEMLTTALAQPINQLDQFYQELLQDFILQERIKTATDLDSMAALVEKMGREKGYSFTKEEVLAAISIETAMGGEYINQPENLYFFY